MSTKKLTQRAIQDLHALAVHARLASYSPYSKFKVGAAVLMKDGSRFSGCNVENASYGGTICAERVAITNAISHLAQAKIQAVMVVTKDKNPWSPCGLCRQVIAEFAENDTVVYLGNTEKIVRSIKFKDLFPDSFGPKNLLRPRGQSRS